MNCPSIGVPVGVQNLVIPTYPEEAEQQGAAGSTLVAVAIDKNGNILSTAIRKSSGNEQLDEAAISGARASTYSGGVDGCSKIGGNIGYDATFSSTVTVAISTL